jgi:hypothetical protein
MSKPSLRKSILVRSVRRLLDTDEQVHDVVMLWTRHRFFLPYCVAAGAALFAVAMASGVEGLVNQVVLAGCGVAVAGMATTNHWVLVSTNKGLVLCRSSRIRQYATAVASRLAPNTPLEMIGSTVVTSDWRLDGMIYTMTKRWEAAMRLLSIEAGTR